MQVAARLSSPSTADVIVPLTFSGSATETGRTEYQFPGSEIIIPAGSLSASKDLQIVDDAIGEGSQLLVVQMGSPVGGVLADLEVSPTEQTLRIAANDSPIIDFRSAKLRASEDRGTLAVLVDLTNPVGQAVSIPYTISGTAVNGEDFTLSPSTPLSFAANQTSAAIDLTVIDDLLVEPGPLETVRLSFLSRQTLGVWAIRGHSNCRSSITMCSRSSSTLLSKQSGKTPAPSALRYGRIAYRTRMLPFP